MSSHFELKLTAWLRCYFSVTDGDGRCGQLLTPGSTITAGIYKITFFTSEYFSKRGITSFYPFVEVSAFLSLVRGPRGVRS